MEGRHGEAFARVMNVEEGQGGDTADFAVNEIQDSLPAEKVYRGRPHFSLHPKH